MIWVVRGKLTRSNLTENWLNSRRDNLVIERFSKETEVGGTG